MMNHPTDAQRAAMTTRRAPLLVSAAAGSGKTATLTERIILRLTDKKDPADLSRLLIVTFTRAAAAELRSRISGALSEAIAAEPGSRHLQKQLLGLSAAHICTIDSFCMDMVKPHFAKFGLPAGFRIADEAELAPLSEHVMEELFEQFFQKYAPAGAAAGRYAMLEGNAFADLCDALSDDRSDDDLPAALRSLYDKLLGYPRGIHLLHDEAEALRAGAAGEFFESAFGRQLYEWKQTFTASAKAFYEEFFARTAQYPDAAKTCNKTLIVESDFINELSAADTYEGVRALFASDLKIPKFTSPQNGADELKDMSEKRKYYKDALKELKTTYFVDDADTVRQDMLRTAEMCDVLFDFLTEYEKRMTAEKQQRGVCDFTDNRRNLLTLLLNEDGTPSPLADEMRAAFDEVYIDEYQDVDEVQDTIFRLIGGDHRFMVGDIKQSIYGFRGADPSLFAGYRKSFVQMDVNAQDTFPDDAPGCCIFMSENFRCDKPVIETANLICGHLFRSCPDSVDYKPEDDLGFAKKVPETAVEHKVLFDVLAKPQDKTSSEEDQGETTDVKAELLYTANCIAGLLRGGEVLDNGEPVRPGDIAVLMRSRTNMSDLIKALQQMGIPAGDTETDDAESAAKVPVSQDLLTGPNMTYLVDLLRVFDNPDTDGPLAEVLRAPFPGLSADELTAVRGSSDGSLYAGLLAYAGAADADPALSRKVRDFIDWLEDYRLKCLSLSAEQILLSMKQDERVAARFSRAFLYLYDSARTGRAGRFTGIYDFLRYFEKKLASDKGSSAGKGHTDSVSIMTMHASKGLEFPIVFIVGVGSYFSHSSKIGDLVFNKRAGVGLRLFDRGSGKKYDPLLYTLAVKLQHLEEHEDDMRLLYVAMTRARERLHVIGTVQSKLPLNEPMHFAPGDRFAVMETSSFLGWCRTALAVHPEASRYAELTAIDMSGVVMETPLDPHAADADEDATAVYYRSLADAMPVVSPEDALLRSIPTKVPASRMSDRLLDECVFLSSDLPHGDEDKLASDETGFGVCDAATAESIKKSVLLMERSGADDLDYALAENRKPTAAEKGTAAHAFLQYCDYARVKRDGVDAELARLTAEHYLDERTASVADGAMLKKFFASRFFAEVDAAVDVRREFRFARFVPLCGLTSNDLIRKAVGSRLLYVQGSVDLLITSPDGRLTLCDYKTDRVTQEERADRSLLISHLTDRHGAQLRQYAAAIREIFGRAPDRVCIFSLPLGEAVEIPI